ncbi:MAG: hypothetical protein IJ774_12820 [Selenomonadaceae bacterium]|nr:hypothetical protein [Selenomonadaceae bacterium]
MKRPIKFRGRDMAGHFVFGLLTKKRIRSSGEIRFAIATGNCSAAETIPVNENSIAQLVGFDCDGREVYEGDTIVDDIAEYVAHLFPNVRISDCKLKEAQQ